MESLTLALISLIVQTPIVLVWTIGIILSLLRWRRHPAISIFTLIALIGFLVTSLMNTYLNVNLPFWLQDKGYSLSQIGSINAVRNVISVLIETCLWILIMISIFGWREKSNISG